MAMCMSGITHGASFQVPTAVDSVQLQEFRSCRTIKIISWAELKSFEPIKRNSPVYCTFLFQKHVYILSKMIIWTQTGPSFPSHLSSQSWRVHKNVFLQPILIVSDGWKQRVKRNPESHFAGVMAGMRFLADIHLSADAQDLLWHTGAQSTNITEYMRVCFQRACINWRLTLTGQIRSVAPPIFAGIWYLGLL